MNKKTKPDILSLLKKSGTPFKIVTIKRDLKTEKEVCDYVMKIEEAHKKAANSKLRFGAHSPICQIGLFYLRRTTHQ